MFDVIRSILAQFNMEALTNDLAQLAADPNLTDEQKYVKVYELKSYTDRFPAMKALQQQGYSMTEAEYLATEKSYKDVLKNSGLPDSFYDKPEDFAKWMTGSVSPAEVSRRIASAQRVIDSADSTLLSQARDYYGLDKDTLLAYVLDPDKAQPIIEKQMRAIETGAAANRYAFQMDRTAAEALASDPLVENLDPVSLRQRFSTARDLATQDSRLSAIDGTTYNANDAVDAVLRDDSAKQLASRQRAEREAARFGGSSGFSSKSLSPRG